MNINEFMIYSGYCFWGFVGTFAIISMWVFGRMMFKAGVSMASHAVNTIGLTALQSAAQVKGAKENLNG